ncbi:MAG: DUF4402 domain-containing protein [Balneolaceae bacterium]
MKKLLLITIVFLFAFTANVFGQETADVAVSTTIEGSLTIVKDSDLGFGTVSSGTTETIAPDAAEAGRVDISGDVGEDYFIGLPETTTLTGAGDDIAVTQSYVGDGDSGNQGTAGALTTGTGGTITTDATTGEFYIWIGGEFTTDQSQANGGYSGTLTITVSKNSI